MTDEKILEEALQDLSSNYKGSQSFEEIFDHLLNMGFINSCMLKKASINKHLDLKMRQNNNNYTDARMDVSIEFEVSEAYVNNCKYKYNHVSFIKK